MIPDGVILSPVQRIGLGLRLTGISKFMLPVSGVESLNLDSYSIRDCEFKICF